MPRRNTAAIQAPPATSHIEVTVLKKFNGKPISNAAVIFDATMDGKDQGNLEVKTDPEGKATIDVIPTEAPFACRSSPPASPPTRKSIR